MNTKYRIIASLIVLAVLVLCAILFSAPSADESGGNTDAQPAATQ